MAKTPVSNGRSTGEIAHDCSRESVLSNAVELSRAVRFTIGLSRDGVDAKGRTQATSTGGNSFAAVPPMSGIGLYGELVVTVQGLPDRRSGYLVNISEIDQAVRQHAVPLIEQRIRSGRTDSAEWLLAATLQVLQSPLSDSGAALLRVRWNLTPYYSLTMSTASPKSVLMAQSFEFAAAHRLHCDDLDDAANRRIFGKCNNPSGHGHNYRVEVVIDKPLDDERSNEFTLPTLERIVHETIIQRFDHMHLNIDTAEFASLNPSVENIVRVCHDLLIEPVRIAGARLHRVTIWETEKTSCTYPAVV